MKKTAIICEINPYHNGHRYIFEQGRENSDQIIIAVMSGNFTQRGLPAVFDKYFRAGLLVREGKNSSPAAADLVVELPFPWCSAGTESFSMGGIAVARGLGSDTVVCGSENGNTDYILAASAARSSETYLTKIRQYEKDDRRGEGSAVLQDTVMRELGFDLGANDKLAAEYARNLLNTGVGFRVYPRISGQPSVPYRSASDLRNIIRHGNPEDVLPYVPEDLRPDYAAYFADAVPLDRFDELSWIFFRLFSDPSTSYAEASGGLSAWIRSAAEKADSAESFFRLVRTKKYTDARIRRAILFSMLHVQGEMLKTPPAYTVLLAANSRGRAYLAELRRSGSFPVITKPSDSGDAPEEQYRLLTAADSLYTMCRTVPDPHALYIKKHPVICP